MTAPYLITVTFQQQYEPDKVAKLSKKNFVVLKLQIL